MKRFQIHRDIARRAAADARPIVQDRTIYEDAEIFATYLHRAGHIDDRDWGTYQDLYRTLQGEIRPPDLMIYLRCPLKTLVGRIKKRGRTFEQKIPRRYLAALEKLYEECRSLRLRRCGVPRIDWTTLRPLRVASRCSRLPSTSVRRAGLRQGQHSLHRHTRALVMSSWAMVRSAESRSAR